MDVEREFKWGLKMRQLLLSLMLMALITAFSSAANAQRVQPMVYELAPSGGKSQTTLTIENPREDPMTVEFVASKISLDENGVESTVSAEDDFLIFPPQAIIRSGEVQSVRVKYIGDPAIEQSVAYRVSIKQVPVDLREANSTGVGFTLNFNTLANVTPPKSTANLTVPKLSVSDNGEWQITIKNDGDRFARLSTTKWTVTDDSGGKVELDQQMVADLTPLNLVLPKSTLVQTIGAIEGIDPNSASIAIRNSK